MQRHILDHPKGERQPHLDRALKREVESKPHPSTLALQKRPKTRTGTARLQEFVRIERSEAE